MSLLQMPWDERATIASDVIAAGGSRDDAVACGARLGEMTGEPADLVIFAVPAGTGVIVESILNRAMGFEPVAVAAAEQHRPQSNVDGRLED